MPHRKTDNIETHSKASWQLYRHISKHTDLPTMKVVKDLHTGTHCDPYRDTQGSDRKPSADRNKEIYSKVDFENYPVFALCKALEHYGELSAISLRT